MWRGGNAEQTRDNVDGTRNVVEAALATTRAPSGGDLVDFGLRYGGRRRLPKRRQACAANSSVNYQRSEVARHRRLRAPRHCEGLEVVIMQPGAIMGPYDIGTWSRLFMMVRDGKLPGVPPSVLTFTHVREVRRSPYRRCRQRRRMAASTCSAVKIKP